MVAEEFLGSGRRPGEGWAPVSLTSPPVLEAVLVDFEIGALGVGGDPIIHHHYEVLAWLRVRLSRLRSFSKLAQRWAHLMCNTTFGRYRSSVWLVPVGASFIHLRSWPVS